MQRIRVRLSEAFMFQALDEPELRIVINAMEEKKFGQYSFYNLLDQEKLLLHKGMMVITYMLQTKVSQTALKCSKKEKNKNI